MCSLLSGATISTPPQYKTTPNDVNNKKYKLLQLKSKLSIFKLSKNKKLKMAMINPQLMQLYYAQAMIQRLKTENSQKISPPEIENTQPKKRRSSVSSKAFTMASILGEDHEDNRSTGDLSSESTEIISRSDLDDHVVPNESSSADSSAEQSPVRVSPQEHRPVVPQMPIPMVNPYAFQPYPGLYPQSFPFMNPHMQQFLTHQAPNQQHVVPDLESNISSSGKMKRNRTIFTPKQIERLEQEFSKSQYMIGSDRVELARDLNLSETQVKVWFQNRRIKNRKSKKSSAQ